MLYNIYFSPTGGTRRVAEALADGFGWPCREIDLCDRTENFRRFVFTEQDVCLISVPAYGGRVPAPALERLSDMTGGGAAAVFVAVFGNRAIDDTLLELQDTLEPRGFVCAGGVAAVAEHSLVRSLAAGRPDEADRAELHRFGLLLREKLSAGTPAPLSLPGSRPYRPFGGSALKPVGDERCIRCGECGAVCPVGAIPAEDPAGVDRDVCISCMRCMAVCPRQCRSVDAAPLAAIGEKLTAACPDRKENTLFI